MMTKEEMNDYLESIGGLENGMFSNKPKIFTCDFFYVDEGWYALIKNLIDDLLQLGWDKKVTQVKEKFGGLRFYICNGSDEIFKRITIAEEESYKICETCGQIGTLRTNIGWYLTLCNKHYDEKYKKTIS